MQCLFYVFKQDEPSPQGAALFALVCKRALEHYRQGQSVFVACDDQQTAEQIDELLWQFDADSFVPHNLQGEGPRQGAPVEIGCHPPNKRRQVLINLCQQVPAFATAFNQVVDFVPTPEQAKQQARLRYSHYRQLGFALSTEDI